MPERTSLTIADAELTDLRAITIRQPYPMLIGRGLKTIETRSRPCSYRGLLAIHAAQKWAPGWLGWADPDGRDEAAWRLNLLADFMEVDEDANGSGYYQPWGRSVPLGAITCLVRVVDCLPIVEAVPIGQHDRDETVIQLLTDDGEGRTRLDVLRREVQGGYIERNIDDQLPYGDFTPGRYGLLLEHVVGFSKPILCKGNQAVPWRVPEDVAAKVREYVEEAGQ